MANGTFGERLKRERELREVTVKEIASATRIAPRFLEALENEEWEKLPGGVFGRGFVRSIARYLGLSEENLLSDYDLARGETSVAAPQKAAERIPSPPTWIAALAVILLIVALVGVVFGGHYAWRWYSARRAAKKTSAVVSIPRSDEQQSLFVRGSASSAVGHAAENPAPLKLSVAVRSSMPLRIASDGVVMYDGELTAGQSLYFSANDKFEVTANNVSGLLLDLNGQTVMPALTPGTSSTISLTSKDLGQPAGGPTQH